MLGDLRAALQRSSAAVLLAPPGAGKTTRIPLALRDEPWLGSSKIVVLEPRRLAARASARFMARTLGEAVGGSVGYRVHLDTRVGPNTRLEVVTEGVLTRLLQSDPTLHDVGLVIFDEFHERSVHADLGLALALETRRLVRPDLRILVMSATLDAGAVVGLLGDAPLVATEGREFPVETRYLPAPLSGRRATSDMDAPVVSTIETALRETEGDVLVFLPGAAEIRRVAARLAERRLGDDVQIDTLHGNLTPEAQDRAILPSERGARKVVLATSIAETSLTIEGVRVVVDSGLARVPRFSPRTGMTRLETVRVSRAAADQRRGRAGRVARGVCYRLWTEIEQGQLVPRARPEILEADLAPLALELAVAGIGDPLELSWLDPPPAASLAQARELLVELEAIDDGGRATPHGIAMAGLAVHPRLAHMLLRALPLDLGATACALAAVLSERDILRVDGGPRSADLRLRLELLGRDAAHVSTDAARHRLRAEAGQLARQIGVAGRHDRIESDAAGLLTAFAYPDRIGQQRGAARGRFVLRNGRGAVLERDDPLGASSFIAVADVDGRQPDSRVFLAAPLRRSDLEIYFGSQFVEEREVAWDATSESVVARRRVRLGAIVLEEHRLADPDAAEVARALAGALAAAGVGALPWSEGARRLRERLAFLHRLDPSWPDVSDAALARSMEDWLAPRLVGLRRRDEVARLDLGAALLDLLDWRRRPLLDELAPTHLVVPSGSRLPIDYADPDAPVLAVRLQEMFGLADTPRVGGGRVPLTLHLLSPAQRPVQVTRDLAGFWRSSYFDVQKELRGRYPKHHWPDDPISARPTARAKRRGE